MSKSPAYVTRLAARSTLVEHRRPTFGVSPLPLAAALALGASSPWALAQTVITPLSGASATQTVVSRPQAGHYLVSTSTVRDGNAFNNLSRLQVGQGDTVGMLVPQGANWLVNVVRDARVQVDGHLEGRLANGSSGGNLLFIDSHGFAVGPAGRVNAGRLVFAAPSSTFIDGLLAQSGGLSGASVDQVLSGQFERSETGAVQIDGQIQASDAVQIMAGAGHGSVQAVIVGGGVVINGRAAGSAVNLGSLRAMAPVVERDGVIDISTPGNLKLHGVLVADGSLWRSSGAVRVVAGGDIHLGAEARLSASAAAGSDQSGGSVTLFAHGSASNAAGALLAARGDGSGSGGFIELSAAKKVTLNGAMLDAGTDTGQTGLAYIDPEDIELVGSSIYTNGTDFVLEASKSLTVGSGVTVNTRKVTAAAGSATGEPSAMAAITADPATPSIGDSGDILLTAPSITVQAGATLDASVINVSGSRYAAGDITLSAEASADWVTLLGFANANASVDVAGTLTGGFVTLQAGIESSAVYDGVSAALTEKGLELLGDQLGSPLALSLAYTEATGNATVNVRETAVLTASRDLHIVAMADRAAGAELQVEGSSDANLSAGFARIAGTAAVDIASGASLSAGENIALVAATKTTVSMTSAAAGETDEETGEANVASVVFAGSLSDVTTRVSVGAEAILSSGGDTNIQAFHSGNYETGAEVTVYGGGTAGVVGALSIQKSTTTAVVGGTVTAGGDVRVMAMNATAKNAISATAETAQKAPEETLELPESLELSSDDAKQQLQLGFMAMAEELAAASEEASGGSSASAESKPAAFKLAGALTWSESDHTTQASLGSGAVVSADGDAVVDAQSLIGQVQSVALSEAASETSGPDASKVALSVAVNYANHAVSTRAEVGSGAEVTAGHVAVNASTDMPEFYTNGLPLDWSSFSSAYENLMGGTDFLLEGFNTRVGSSASGKTLAAAGAVNLSFMRNDTRAWVNNAAKITTTVNDGAAWSYDLQEVAFDSDLVEMFIGSSSFTLDKDLGVFGDFVSDSRVVEAGDPLDEISFSRTFSGSTVVRAETHVQTLHHAGGDAPEAGESGTSVGGTFTMVDRRNITVAGIADVAEVSTHRLDVSSRTEDWLVSISPTSGGGAGMAANGMASYNKLSQTTRASISREARVTAPTVNVDAELSLGVLAVTGAVTQSENSGVGIGVAINDMTGDTRAYVGDNDSDGGGSDTVEGVVGYVRTGRLQVNANTDGMIVAVGVAGAVAGKEPSPEEPDPAAESEPNSTGDNLADGVAEKSAAEQAQLDGSDASMAPVEEASAPAKGEGTDDAAAEDPAASKPPSFSIAGAGAIVTNFSDLDTTALLDGALVSGVGSGTNTVGVQAVSDLTQVSVAGGGALSLAKNTSTTFTAAIAGAVAIQKSDDDTTARILDSTLSDLADQSGSLVLRALKSGERTAVATGISANLSKGSTTSLSLVGSASVTTTSDDTSAEMVRSDVSGDASTPVALGVEVVAYDRSRIGAGGGALSVSTGKGSAGVGAAISVVNAQGSTQAHVSDGSITRAHDLAVLALSSQKIVGVAAVAGVQTNGDASSLGQLMGSFVYNHIDNTISTSIKNGAVVNLTGDLALQAGGAPSDATLDALLGSVRSSEVTDYEMASASNGYSSEFKDAVGGESIVGVAGTLGVTLGGNANSFGLSYVHNDIQTTYDAELNGSITAGGGVTVSATSRADIVGVAAGVGATKGKFSGMGSVAVNLIGQRTEAALTGGSVGSAGLLVLSSTQGNAFALAGNLSFAVGSGNGSAGGAAVAYTQTGTKTYTVGSDSLSTRAAGNAATIDHATVNVGSGSVQVQASNVSDLQSVAASGVAADGNVGFAGTVTVNETADVTAALISSSTLTAGSVQVQAGEGSGVSSARIRSLAGGLSASKGYSGALALGFNTIESTRSAQILSSTLHTGSAVSVLADSAASIQTLSVTLAGGKDYALAGSSSTNVLNGTTLSNVEYTTINGAATALSVHASQSGSIESLAGAVSGAGTGAIGGAVAVNLMGEGSDDFNVTARLKDSVLAAPLAVSVESQLSGSIGSVAASGSGAGTGAINGSVTTNSVEATVVAEVVGGSQSSNGGAFSVQAVNDADIDSLAGTISGAGTAAVGAAVSVNEIGGEVLARVQNHTLRSNGAVDVQATSSGSVRSIAAGASGGGSMALAGSNTTNSITSTVLAQIDRVTQAAASASLTLQALDSSTIQSFAGSVAGGGSAAGGAAFALNFLGRTADNADRTKIVAAEVLDSDLNVSGAVQVKALSTSTIESMAVAVGVSGNAAVTGSNTTNLLEDEISARWSGGSLNGATTSLTVLADDAASVHTLAGNVSGSGAGAFGAAIAVNQIGSVAHATLSGMTLGAAAAVLVDADLRGEIRSVAASGAASAGVSINGSFTTNEVNASVKAEVSDLTQSVIGSTFAVRADNDADVFSVAGTVSGSGSAAAGAAVAVNEIGGDVTARVSASTLRASGTVDVQATSSGIIQSVAAGMAGGGSMALAGSNTTNAITSTVLSQLDEVNMVVSASSLSVLARDTSTIQSFAGSVAGGGVAGGGAALALNFLGRTASDEDGSKVVKAQVTGSMVRSTGAVNVNAYSTSVIESIGVAAGVSGTTSISGSNTTNLLEDEISASWAGSGLNTTSTLTVSARQASDIDSLAGNVSGSLGASVGAAVAVNRIGTVTQSNLKGVRYADYRDGVGYWTEIVDDLVLSAESDNEIDTIAVGMSAGSAGVQGSVAVSAITSRTTALLGADGYVSNMIAEDTVAVTANSRDRIRSLAGAVGLGVAGVGAAGGLQTNIVSSTTSAGVAGWDTHVNAKANGSGLTLRDDDLVDAPDLMNISEVSDSVLDGANFGTRNVKGLAVQATSIQQIGATTAVAGGGAAGAAGASVNVDKIGGSTRAFVENSIFFNDWNGSNAAQSLDVMAANHAMIASSTTALAIGAVGVSGSVGTEIIDRSTRAEVRNVVTQAQSYARVQATSTNSVAQIAAGAAGGAIAGIAGSGDVVLLQGETVALVDSSTVRADSISVLANGTNASNLVAGAVSYSGVPGGVGVGLSFTVNVSGSTVRALVDNSALAADGAVIVDADNNTRSLSVSASAAAGGGYGVAVGTSVSIMEGATEAAVKGTSTVSKRTLATGLVASAQDAPVTLHLASPYDLVGTNNQSTVRLSLHDLVGQVSSASAVVTVSDGEKTVTAVRQSDGTYSADVSTLADGVLLAQVVISESGVSKVSTTTLSKSTGINASETEAVAAGLPSAQTRIETLSGFAQVDARNHEAVTFVLKADSGPTADNTASVIVSDGTRQVSAVLNADGSYTADVRSLGDGVLTALVTVPAGGAQTARVTFVKQSGAASLSITANETVELNHNTGQLGVGGGVGVGASANVVIGKSTVDATLSAASVRVSGDLTVAAERDADIDMVTATGGGGGLAGVSGAVGVLIFGSAPDSNASAELDGDDGSLRQVSAATEADRVQGAGSALSTAETSALNASGSYDTRGAFNGATGGHRTSATVTSPLVVAGGLSVRSLDRTVADNSAGAVALGGIAGVSAGVAITRLGGANHAGVTSASLVVADDVSIDSGTRSALGGAPAIESTAIAGAGGFVGVGAAVSVATNETANTATLASGLQAGGSVDVRAMDQASLVSRAYGTSVGAVTVGVVTATATQSGSVGTSLGGSLISNDFAASAERDASTTAEAYGGVAGVFAGSGAGASASDDGVVTLTLASGTSIDAGAGDISLAARANPSASTSAFGVSVASGAAVGVSVAESSVQTTVGIESAGPVTLRGNDMLIAAVLGSGDGLVSADAVAGGGGLLLGLQGAAASADNQGSVSVDLQTLTLEASGNVGVSASDSMRIEAMSTGVGAGFVGAGVAVASASSHSTVNTSIDALGGLVIGNLGVSARGDEVIDSDAVAGSGGVVAGAGAEANVLHVQNVGAAAGTVSGGVVVQGVTTISADRKVRYDSQSETVNASAFGGSGAVASASLTGEAVAGLNDDASLAGGQLRVLATNNVERLDLSAVSARGGGGGVLAGAGADASTVISGDAVAFLGDDVSLNLGLTGAGLLELRAYNQLIGSSLGRLDLGGAVPVALVDTSIESIANADASIGNRNSIFVAGDVYANAMSYIDIEANTITKTYGAAAAAQGDAASRAEVENLVSVGTGSNVVGEGSVTLLAGQDRDYWRNKHFVTARADLFNHSAIPVSINPDVTARLNLTNNVDVRSTAVRSGGTIKLGGIDGTYVVEGKGKVSDWTRDVGELVGISSSYGSSSKNLQSDTYLSGEFEAGYGNKQIIVINPNGSLDDNQTQGNIRYTITTEDLAATGAAYLDSLYNQLKNYGDIPEVRAFVEAEIAFYLDTLIREGFATLETDPETNEVKIVPQQSVPGTFLTLQNVRAGSGNVELFGNNVTGNADLIARADSEILIDNKSPMNIRVKDLIIDSSGGFIKYNGAYLTESDGSDIAAYNKDVKNGLSFTVDSIDTRGGGAGEELPSLKVLNSYQSTGQISDSAVIAVAPDGTSADLRQDQMRAPEIRVNGLLYNKLGPIILGNTSGSISVVQEDPLYVPRLDGLEIQVNAGKNIVLSSPSVSQSVGGSPENLYAVAYTDDQQRKLDSMGVVRCGTARAGTPSATSFSADCQRNGSGGIYASGGVFLGARYLNINGTVQSGQPDYKVTLTDGGIGSTITEWESQWTANRGTYLAQGRSSLVQVAGRLPTDNETEVNKQFANGEISQSQRDTKLLAMAQRREQPIVYYDAESDRLKVAATEVTGGLVEVVGSIINTGGGVIRALDGYARFDIDNQTSYGMDLLGLDTGGDSGVVRITDLNRPVYTGDRITAYEVTTYQRDPVSGQYKATTTAGRGSTVLGTPVTASAVSNPARPELRASFTYNPLEDSTYVWSAGYEYGQEKRYWYQKSSALWGAINLGSIRWNSVDTINKTASAMPEGIYVTTEGAPAQNFFMDTKSLTTSAEKQIYYRSWKKCGFLCFKKTYYVDYRTEVGQKDVFTQRVRADHPIAIELVGYNTGLIDVTSKGDVRIAGNITNDSGLVSIDSTHGAIEQLSGGSAVNGNDLRFYAAKGIGNEGAPVNVITGTGSFTAQSDSGNVAFQSLGGALRINQVSTTGKVWLMGDESIVGVNPGVVHVTGSRIELSAPRGGIGEFNEDGSVRSTLNIQTESSAGGGIAAHASRGIALKQGSGDLWVDQIASDGADVYIETAGDLIDNNRNESRDLRTEEELLALWSAAALQGSGAEESRQLTLSNTRSQYRRYWGLRNAQVTSVNPSTGVVTGYTADAFDPDNYTFSFSAEEKLRLSASGLTTAQIAAMEASRTTEFLDLHRLYGTTTYQINDAIIISEVNAALVASGSVAVDAQSSWSDAELRSPLPKAIFSKSSTDTQTRIEEPNVVGKRVVLRPGGQIGRDEGAVTIDLLKAGGLTTDDQLTIMSAESDDMTLDKTDWLLTVVKKDTFNVLSDKLNVRSNGFVYLGADETDAYPDGGDANLEQVIGNGEIRIKVSGSIINASNSSESVIQGHKAILEAASGSIGTALKPVTLSLSGGGNASAGTLVARAEEGIWISQPSDIRVADVYSPGMVSLTAQGAIIDARGPDRTRALEAGEANLVALGGSVGTLANPFVAKVDPAGGVNASTPAGYSVYLQGAETGLSVKSISSGLDIHLRGLQQGVQINGNLQAAGSIDVLAAGNLTLQGLQAGDDILLQTIDGDVRAEGSFSAIGRIDVTAGGSGSIAMSSGTRFQAVSGDIYLSADDVGLSEVDAARAVVVVAAGDITDTSEGEGTVNAGGMGVTLVAGGSIGTRDQSVDVLTKDRTRLVATSGVDAFLSADSANMRISQVSAGGDAVLSSAYSLIDDRGTRAQAVDASNIELIAGGNIGATTLPMTVQTAADGAVRNASAGGSVYLSTPAGLLTVLDGGAQTGQMALDGSAGGLSVGGRIATAQGLALNGGGHAVSVLAGATISNSTGSTVLRGASIAMADGATIDGGVGTLVLSAGGDIAITGLRSANNTAGAVVISSTRGAVLDGGETRADITLTDAAGVAVVSAYGNIGDASLDDSARDHALDTSASSLMVTSKTGSVSLAQQGVLRDAIVSASLDADLHGDASVAATQVSSSLGSVSVSSQTAGVRLASIRSALDIGVQAAGRIELTSFTAPRDLSIVTLGTAVDPTDHQGIVAGSLAAGRDVSIIAGSSANAELVALLARTGSMAVEAGGTLSISGTAKANGGVNLSAEGQLGVGVVSSSTAGVNISANNGGIRYTSISATGVAHLQATRDDDSLAVTDIQGGSITARAADPATAVTVNAEAGSLALGNITATTGGVNLNAHGGLSTGSIKAVSQVSVAAGGLLSTGALSSSAAGVDLSTNNGGIRYTTIAAAGAANLQASRDDGSTAATDIQGGNITARAVDPLAAVSVSSESGSVTLGNISAATGGVSLSAQGGGLSTGSIKSSWGVTARSGTFMNVGAVSSTNSSVWLQAAAGPMTATSIIARTQFDAEAGGTMNIKSFAVSHGNASLEAGTELTVPKGSASGAISLTAGGHAVLGALTSSASRIDAIANGGLSYTSLKAASGIGLRANSAFGLGANSGYALVGGTVDAGVGGLNAFAAFGHLQIGRLLARNSSVLEAQAGHLTVASISNLTPSQLTTRVPAGTVRLPAGY